MAEIQDLDPTDANNTGRWPEGMLGGQINDAGRSMEGYLARWFRDTNGFLAASGSSNAFTLTSSRTISSLTDGLLMTFRANHAITGAATLNLNGLGAKDIKRFNGNALASGDIISGQPVMVLYSSALDDWLMVSAAAALTGNSFFDLDGNATPGNPASGDARVYFHPDGYVAARESDATEQYMWGEGTRAKMEAATSDEDAVQPGNMHFHPGMPKAWGRVSSDGTLVSGYNVTSSVRDSTGNYTITLADDMADSNYAIQLTVATESAPAAVAKYQSIAAGSFQVATQRASNDSAQNSGFSFVVYGTLG